MYVYLKEHFHWNWTFCDFLSTFEAMKREACTRLSRQPSACNHVITIYYRGGWSTSNNLSADGATSFQNVNAFASYMRCYFGGLGIRAINCRPTSCWHTTFRGGNVCKRPARGQKLHVSHPSPQKFVSIPVPSMLVQQLTEYGLNATLTEKNIIIFSILYQLQFMSGNQRKHPSTVSKQLLLLQPAGAP